MEKNKTIFKNQPISFNFSVLVYEFGVQIFISSSYWGKYVMKYMCKLILRNLHLQIKEIEKWQTGRKVTKPA